MNKKHFTNLNIINGEIKERTDDKLIIHNYNVLALTSKFEFQIVSSAMEMHLKIFNQNTELKTRFNL